MSAHDELIEPRPRGALGRFRAFREERPHLFLLVLMMLVAFFIYFAARAEALHVEFEYAPSELQNETVVPSPMRDISTPVNQPTIYSNPKNSVGL